MSVSKSPLAWGRLPHAPQQLRRLHHRRELPPATAGLSQLAYGNGRSYGDACLNSAGELLLTRGLDRFIAFDDATGLLHCEAGVLLDDIITALLPRGWFLPVTPGTRYATLGGAVANDVHGKNHHRAGTIGEHLRSLTLLRSDGRRIVCGPTEQPEWLHATIGGLGLTGVIVDVHLQLRRVDSAWMDSETRVFRTLAEFFALSAASPADWEYTVAWVDCLHGRGDTRRGVYSRANHASALADDDAAPPSTHPRSLRLTPPFSLVNGATLRAFNSLYFERQRRRQGSRIEPLLPFFYPLDALLSWNRIYGPRGFYQYQCVVPPAVQVDATTELLDVISRSGSGSFLAVLKTFGERQSPGLLSFPMAGTTLALDFPNQGERTLALLRRLDTVVQQAGGRVYPAKDVCMNRALFRSGYPNLDAFLPFRDPGIASDLSRRLID